MSTNKWRKNWRDTHHEQQQGKDPRGLPRFKQVTYDSGTVSTHLDTTRIDQLPQNGRNLLGLAGVTTPGLEGNGTRANGLMQEGLEYTQDGAPMTNRNFGGVSNSAQATLPDPDSVQEVKIETLNSSAQFATPATAIITTKSGTNQFHGSLFETHRNNAIGIARARQNQADFAAPHLVRNEFGASVGGPIIIPKLYHGASRSFFFFAYERFSLRQAANQLVTVPTVAMRNGDFSGLGVVHIQQRESLPDQFTVRLQGGNFNTGRGFVSYSPDARRVDAQSVMTMTRVQCSACARATMAVASSAVLSTG